MKPKLLLSLILLMPALVFAKIFVVTSNADNGAGTLREAINNAAANGISEQDIINFAIPDQSEAGRTILIASTLPELSGNLTIDGSTQSGKALGLSDAKICIKQKTYTSGKFAFMQFKNVNNINIFGLMFYDPFMINLISEAQAIQFINADNVVIGKPGKGNYFIGFEYCINTMPDNDFYSDGGISDFCDNLSFQSNMICLNEKGLADKPYEGAYYLVSEHGIYLWNARNILIGGDAPEEGNYIYALESIYYKTTVATGNGDLKIINNKIGTDYNGDIDLGGASSTYFCSMHIQNGFESDPYADVAVEIKRNTMVGGVFLYHLATYFKVQSNKIFSNNVAGLYETDALIAVGACKGGIIGGDNPQDGNELFGKNYNSLMAYHFSEWAIISGDYTEIKNNVIHCNKYEGNPVASTSYYYYYFDSPDNTEPWVITDVLKEGYVEGRACANCRIDVYEDDECSACEGKLLIGSVIAANNGKWSFSGNFKGSVVATATDKNKTTFAFSNPFVRDDSAVIVQPDCNLKNGSIKGMQLVGADGFEWKKIIWNNNTGEQAIYITDKTLDIDNLEAGTYELTPRFGSTCNGISRRYILKDQTYRINDKNALVTQPSCGNNSGAIRNIFVSNPDQTDHEHYAKLEWKDALGNTEGTSTALENVFAGSYKLYVTSNGGCIDSSQQFTLVNQAGPSFEAAEVQVISATCNQSNGAIKNITINNTSGTPFIQWQNEAGIPVGSSLELTGVAAGKYQLKFKDNAACDTLITPFYTVPDTGSITIDESNKNVKASSCATTDGAILNITAPAADFFKWMNISTGKTAGNELNISGIGAGSYMLIASNKLNCVAQSSVIVVPQSNFATLHIAGIQYTDASCDKANGSIQPKFSNNDIGTYQFQWVNAADNTSVTTTLNADNLQAATYSLLATDANQCKQKVLSQTIQQLGKPTVNTSHAVVVDDVCNTAAGYIKNVDVSGGSNGYQWQWYNDAGPLLNNTSAAVSSLKEGHYYAIITDKSNCSVTTPVFIVQNKNQTLILPVLSAEKVAPGVPATINILNFAPGTYELYADVNTNIAIGFSSLNYLTTPVLTENKEFYVVHRNGDCASMPAKITAEIFKETKLFIPSAFSPDNNGINDKWQVKSQGIISHYKALVYNRFGQLIFSATDINKAWDGKLQGVAVPAGTYLYIISAEDNTKRLLKASGTVTVVY